MPNNPQLFNAALSGAAGSAKVSRTITNPLSASYASDRAAAVAFATAVDAAIPLDAQLTSADVLLMQSICISVLSSKVLTSSSDSANIALAIAALYTQIAPSLSAGVTWGGPIYNVADFGAIGDGIADDTAAINAAIAAANATPGNIYLMQAHRITGSMTTISGNNVYVIGRGEFNGGSRIIVDSVGPIDVFTFTGQYGGLFRIWIVGLRVYSAGWAVTLSGFRNRITECVISEVCFGLRALNSNGCYIEKVVTTNLWGVFMFAAFGSGGGSFNHALTFKTCMAGTSFPGAIVGNATIWAPATAYVVGNVVTRPTGIYQCIVSGTSGGTGPTGIPSTVPATAHTTPIVDGTAQWVFAMPLFVGFLQGSFVHTFEVIDCGVLQGLFGGQRAAVCAF
jgi:hypothetical protein